MRTLASERSSVPGAADLDHHIDAATGGEPQHLALPVGMGLVVDAVVGAELLGARELGVAAEVMMACAPAALANCSAKIETPPVPSSSTVWPGLRSPTSNRLFHAVTAAQGSVAASA